MVHLPETCDAALHNARMANGCCEVRPCGLPYQADAAVLTPARSSGLSFQRDGRADGCGAFWFDGLAGFVVVVESAGALVRLLSVFSLLQAASASIAAS